MKGRRVKITGIGFVTPTGIGKEAFRQGILESRSHVSVVKRFPEDGGEFVAAEVKKFNVGEYNDDPASKRLPRHTQFALAAARMALDDAKLSAGPLLSKLAPIVITGTSLMDSAVINKTIEDVTKKGPRFGLARVVFQGPVAAIPAAVAESVGGARTLSLQSACCGGSDAIGQAAQIVANGEADIAICGGTEAPIYYHPMLELRMAGLSPATSERPEQLCRPFDLWRTTGVIGEGAAIVVLEPEESPRPGYAFVRGYSFATDVAGQPGEGWRNAVEMALANARIDPSQVDSINAWGPGHKEIDAIEVGVLRTVFGARLDNIPATSIKGAIGNPFAAAGAIQVGCAALGMQESFIPPTVNWTHPDPACRLNLSNRARFVPSALTLVNSHGVSGTNSCLLLERCS